eukprot:9692309-Karenia_brevis.AAC.1
MTKAPGEQITVLEGAMAKKKEELSKVQANLAAMQAKAVTLESEIANITSQLTQAKNQVVQHSPAAGVNGGQIALLEEMSALLTPTEAD